jgi:ketosteroid isomerase-like protein
MLLRFACTLRGAILNTPAVNDTSEGKKAVFRRLVDIYATGDLSALDEVIAPNYVGHASAGDRDLEGFRKSILYFHNLFIYDEDSFEVNDQFVEGEKVATRMTAHVKVRATGEPVTLIGINLARIVDGKIVEEWNTWEQLQLPKPPEQVEAC